jgi:hypothetical protein
MDDKDTAQGLGTIRDISISPSFAHMETDMQYVLLSQFYYHDTKPSFLCGGVLLGHHHSSMSTMNESRGTGGPL